MRDLPNLDFLRCVAVIAVVVEHILLAYGVLWLRSWEVQWIGVVGVFFFFVHTSTVLMWSLERKPHTLDFYIRRAFRLYPLAWLALASVFLFHVPVNGTPDHFFKFAQLTGGFRSLLKAVLLVPNLGLAARFLPMSVMWSLPYELEMYLLLPFLFFLVRRKLELWPLVLLWLLVVWVNRPLFPEISTSHNFYLCIPYFLPGVMAYAGFSRFRARLPAWSFGIFLALLWVWFMHDPYWRKANVLCLTLGLGLPLFHQIKSRVIIRVSHAVAKYSYGIYLGHPFAIVLGLYLLPHRPLALQLGVMIAATAVFSVIAYHSLEYPMIRLGSRIANRTEQIYERAIQARERIAEAEIN